MEVLLSPEAFDAWLATLYERDDRLDVREAGGQYLKSEDVDAYVLSGHAEALISEDIDGDVWGTLADIDEEAGSEEAAWAKIRAFYLDRGNVVVKIGGGEEWILSEALARRLQLPGLEAR
ncbi:hypothetical protein DKM44_05095 [Deinococcus irradiatisoli]|uniref:Uncharacterized protein n=1 Tax=Deinococcus irradiatisoli TaxID=2202254 RepID=A0A2Z3JCK7_9DEIO|nr:hypothetical protein [Deinococcus irradiatisoli]AWN22685.1 hypothetical protein DKM44_05095 [Deinococcus irradiatisoli]